MSIGESELGGLEPGAELAQLGGSAGSVVVSLRVIGGCVGTNRNLGIDAVQFRRVD